MSGITIRNFAESDRNSVIGLWRTCGLIIGTVMFGYEGHRGWTNYLAVSLEHRKKGIGRRLMDEAEARLRTLGCPKISLQIRTSNTEVIDFYRKLGFSPDDVVSMGKRLEKD